ncbi:Phenylacetate-coenzyme A ligase [Octadecabacter ascidiaceicola]|uniref:Phenylacetate-coenzyme A ligase n=2 Tax=Octadecabacter ascidiaceicola TaxID=1655543 RepID=A0A238JLX4_9RHOB|nr:Phenylacetate-coenzyme A ligase [Octadecabacter ascidiaceicola]
MGRSKMSKLDRLNAVLGADQQLDSLEGLANLPVTRKDELLEAQRDNPPFGGHRPNRLSHIFQSPGPIYEPGLATEDFWRFGRFAKEVGLSETDVVLNTFAYHFTPAGAMFEAAARANGAVVVPTGPGSSRQQVEVAAATGVTAYVGTPDFLQIILDRAAESNTPLPLIKFAFVSAGPLFPAMRQAYEDRGILCRQCYGTADVGLIAYETAACTNGMVIDEDVIVEIVSPGTGTPVPHGEIGEVVVTVLNPDHPMIRFSVGDLSAFATDEDPSGETRARIVGWRGRADQATKVKGMFIRPEQVSKLVADCADVSRARVEVTGSGMSEQIEVMLECSGEGSQDYSAIVQDILKLRSKITTVEVGSLPRDGILVSDLREVP